MIGRGVAYRKAEETYLCWSGTVGVGGHGDEEGDADVEEVDDRKRAVA